MSKFFVDYDSMYDEYSTRYHNRKATTLLAAEAAALQAGVKRGDPMFQWEVHNMFQIGCFERFGKNVIRVEKQLATDLIATQCTVPIEALKTPWSTFYISFDASVLPGPPKRVMPQQLRFDGCYVTVTTGNIFVLMVNSEVRKTDPIMQMEMVRPYVFKILKELNIGVNQSSAAMAAEMILTSCMGDGRFFVIKTDGFDTVDKAVDHYVKTVSEKYAAETETRKDIDNIEAMKLHLKDFDGEVPDGVRESLEHMAKQTGRSRELANKIIENTLGSGVGDVRSVSAYIDQTGASRAAITQIDPAMTSLVVNLCVYINNGDFESIPAKARQQIPATNKALKKEKKQGYSGSYMLAGHGYKSDITDNVSGNALNINCWVRGHWRNQACGERHSQRKHIYIKPFRKGVGEICQTHVHRIAPER